MNAVRVVGGCLLTTIGAVICIVSGGNSGYGLLVPGVVLLALAFIPRGRALSVAHGMAVAVGGALVLAALATAGATRLIAMSRTQILSFVFMSCTFLFVALQLRDPERPRDSGRPGRA
jgi:hypothetical protein